MANFNWAEFERAELYVSQRFSDDAIGFGYWRELMQGLMQYRSSWNEPEGHGIIDKMFSKFLVRIRKTSQQVPVCRVFVSHQRKDSCYAESIAFLANQQGFEYWLDIHDPVLRVAGSTVLPPLIEAVLIASIVEMNLLNCSHVCSVQTSNAVKSRWVPYEFGRAKERKLHSMQAASWFAPGMLPSTAEYLLLGRCLTSTGDIKKWLKSERTRLKCDKSTAPAPWLHPEPAELPN